ncbi:MAG: CBS domain-containing protein [Steroidobacteraceae bacterium]|jgi:acetoin utilization protein AcuB
MKLGDIMTRRLVTVELDDSLATVKQIFDSLHFHHLLVIGSDKKLCGVISDRDLLRAISPYVGTVSENARDSATLKKRAHQIMTRSPLTLSAEANVADAIQLFIDHRVSCIPIVDEGLSAVGIVSWRDILRSLVGSTGA